MICYAVIDTNVLVSALLSSKDDTATVQQDGDLKIYEISDLLRFESAFHFSRVFKKVIGVSPRDYGNQIIK